MKVDTYLHHVKNFLSHELIPYAPSIFERTATTVKIVVCSGGKSAFQGYLKTKSSLNE